MMNDDDDDDDDDESYSILYRADVPPAGKWFTVTQQLSGTLLGHADSESKSIIFPLRLF